MRTVRQERAWQRRSNRRAGLGCLRSLGSQRIGGLGDRVRGSACDKLLLLLATLIVSPWSLLEFRRCVSVGEDVREGEWKGNGVGCFQRECACAGFFVIRLSSLS